MRAFIIAPVAALSLFALGACDKAREVANDIGISKDAQAYCEALFGGVLPDRETPADQDQIAQRLQQSLVACMLDVARDFLGRRAVEVAAVDASAVPSLAGDLVTTEPQIAAKLPEAELISEAQAEALQ